MANLSDKIKLGKSLFNADKATGQSTIAATAAADSSDGMVTVTIGGEQVAIPTIGAVSEGDTVQVDVRDGKPVAIGSAGWGDDIQGDVDETTNHFWTDPSLGAVVSKNEQPEDPDDIEGANTVIGAGGMSIRDGQTVLAKFASSMIELGKNSINAVISFCDGKGKMGYFTRGSASGPTFNVWSKSGIAMFNDPWETGQSIRKSGSIHMYGDAAEITGTLWGVDPETGEPVGSSSEMRVKVSSDRVDIGSETLLGGSISISENGIFIHDELHPIHVQSGGYAGNLYGWTCIVDGTVGTTSTAINVSNAQEIMIAACNSSGPTYLTATIPIQLIGSTQSEYRLTGGFSDSATTGMHHANVKLSKTLFSPQWYYRNSQDATSISTFYLYAR